MKKQRKIKNLLEYRDAEIKGNADPPQREIIYDDVDSMPKSKQKTPKKQPILYPHNVAVAFYLNDENILYHHQKRISDFKHLIIQ